MEKEKKGKKECTYSTKYKMRVLKDMIDTGASISEVASRYHISKSAIYQWISIFGIELPEDHIGTIMTKDKEALQKEIAELRREIKKLKLEAWDAKVDALCQKTLLEEVAQKYNIDLKKKTDLPR